MQKPDILSFGRYLKAIRESSNITLISVADRLRVSVWLLILIEAEDHEKLPNEIYVKGTLRAYAEAIGVDSADVIERYEINRRAYDHSLKSEQDLIKSGKQSIIRMAGALGVLGLAVMISVMIFDHFHDPAEYHLMKKAVGTGSGVVVDDLLAYEIHSSAGRLTEQAFRLNDRLHLKLVAMSEIDITLRIDDGTPVKYKLNPNDEMQVEASSHFHLSISDASGISVYLNDQPVFPKGDPGRPASILLRKDAG